MTASHFASQLKKDFDTEMIRTKIAEESFLSEEADRYDKYEGKRHSGLTDVNLPTLEGRNLELEEASQEPIREEMSVRQRSAKSLLSDQRRQRLQKYLEEKQLKKLREKPQRPPFIVGIYRPDKPIFLSSIPAHQPKKIVNGSDVRATRSDRRQTSEKKVSNEKTAGQPEMPMCMRTTPSMTQRAKQTTGAASTGAGSAAPAMRAVFDNKKERKVPNQGKPAKRIQKEPGKVISFKVYSELNTLELQTNVTNGTDPDGVLSKMEKLPKTNPEEMKGRPSFAPANFLFRPPDGLKSYDVTPRTPTSTATLSPGYSCISLKTEVDKTLEVTKEILACKSKTSVHQDSNELRRPLSSLSVGSTDRVLNKNETTTENLRGFPIKEVPSLERNEDQTSQQRHVLHFRSIPRYEREELILTNCLEWERKLEAYIPNKEDLIPLGVDQKRLVKAEIFKRFEELLDNLEYKLGKKDTTCADLDGFWDMASFQIQDLCQKFNNLTILEECGWEKASNTSKDMFQDKVVSGIVSEPKQDDARIADGGCLTAVKKAVRERMQLGECAEAMGSAVPKEVDRITFDAGSFRIKSPIKSFSGYDFSDFVERRRQEHARHASFGGDLIAFSPRTPPNRNQPEEL
uniref:DLG associated protein 5 n=1 Tax=Equus caballus TaxID=9796 RepID=A0A5F5PMF8_HORSE